MTIPKEALQKCSRCALRGNTCICGRLQSIDNRPNVTIIRHRKEVSRGSNSARILEASLQNVHLIEHGARYAGPTVLDDTLLENAALLFPLFYDPDPNHSPKAWTDIEPPKNLIILDGSWKQTSRMLKKIDRLTHLPRLTVKPLDPPLPRIRQPYFAGGMCTMEAAISALAPYLSETEVESLKQNYLTWLDQVRKNSGIRNPLQAGQSFKEARIAESQTVEDQSTNPTPSQK